MDAKTPRGHDGTESKRHVKRKRAGGSLAMSDADAERDYFGESHTGEVTIGLGSSWAVDGMRGGDDLDSENSYSSDSDTTTPVTSVTSVTGKSSSVGAGGGIRNTNPVGLNDDVVTSTLGQSLGGDIHEIPDSDDDEDESEATKSDFEKCWACRQAAFSSGLHDKGRYSDLLRLVRNLVNTVNRERLVQAVDYYYEKQLRYDGGEDQGEWPRSEIKAHLFDHMSDMSLEAMNQVHNLRKLSKYLSKRLLTMDEDGDVSVDSKNVQNYLRVNTHLLKTFGAPTQRALGFNPELTLTSATHQ